MSASSSNLRPKTGRIGTIRLTAGQAVTRYLSAQFSERDGQAQRLVPALFGIFGHGNVCGLAPALEEPEGRELRLHQAKNEQAMVHAAIGYAKASNLMSTLACSASIGPGATNMLTGAATATVNRVPVLLLPSDTFANRRQGPVMQALENPSQADMSVNDAFRPVSAYFDRITRPEQLLTALPEAMRTLTEPSEVGAVTLSLHQDVQGEGFAYPTGFFEPRTWVVPRRPPAESELRAAVKLLGSARRPMIIAGGGVHYSDATAVLREFAEDLGIPVVETSAGKGALSRSPMELGGVGVTGTRAANRLARDADVVLCVGTRMIDLTTASHSLFENPHVGFISANVRPSDAHKLGASPLVGDARECLRALHVELTTAGYVSPPDWRKRADAEKAEWTELLNQGLASSASDLPSQAQVLHELNQYVQAGDQVVVAAGTPHVDIHKIWESSEAVRCFMEVGFSCMAGEIPSAIGARLARPDAGEIYALIGDGTYLMGNTGELVTAVQEALKITVIVFVNDGWQSIHGLQRRRTGRSFGLEFRHRERETDSLAGAAVSIDYAQNAASLGCASFEAKGLEEFRKALIEARAETRPTLIAVRTDSYVATPDPECWWDVGLAQESTRAETVAAYQEHEAERHLQRVYY